MPDEFATAVWPWAASSLRYEDPVGAAQGFAEEFIGFESVVVGEFQPGDNRSGEVEVRPSEDGPATVVFVRQLGSDASWWVLGAATENITLDRPTAMDLISEPLVVSGQATNMVGEVELQVRADGDREPVFSGAVTAGIDELTAFDEQLGWTNPRAGSGSVVIIGRDADDAPVEAVVVRVILEAGGC